MSFEVVGKFNEKIKFDTTPELVQYLCHEFLGSDLYAQGRREIIVLSNERALTTLLDSMEHASILQTQKHKEELDTAYFRINKLS